MPRRKGHKHTVETKLRISLGVKRNYASMPPERKKEMHQKTADSQRGTQRSEKGRENIRKSLNTEKERTRRREAALLAFPKLLAAQRRKSTRCEIALYAILDDLSIPYQKQYALGRISIPDAVDVANKIAFYADGNYWHNLPSYRERDARIAIQLDQIGYRVLRYWESDLLRHPQKVRADLSQVYKNINAV